jgi:hypothetical protein
MLFALKLGLRVVGYRRVMTWIANGIRPVPAVVAADIQRVRETERAVATAGALYPGRALCLEQSLVLYYYLRKRGVAVQYCQGVASRPFEAHAWLEYRGEVINDIAEHARRFARLPAQLP